MTTQATDCGDDMADSNAHPAAVPATERPLRADARRKREALLAAAVEVFAEHGVQIALDEVARRAGVGIGTLYRHFPTREALITGAYLREIHDLCDGVDLLLAEMPADRAIVAWMQRFVGYVAGKPGMAMALKTIVLATDSPATEASHQRIYESLGRLMAAGQAGGTIRDDISPEDLANVMSGISLASGTPGSAQRANRIVELVVDGLRYGLPSATGKPQSRPRRS